MSTQATILFGLGMTSLWFGALGLAWWLFDRIERRRAGASLLQWRRIRRFVP